MRKLRARLRGSSGVPDALRRLLAAIESERLVASDRHCELIEAIERLQRDVDRLSGRQPGAGPVARGVPEPQDPVEARR
jgi:hypothetical protein